MASVLVDTETGEKVADVTKTVTRRSKKTPPSRLAKKKDARGQKAIFDWDVVYKEFVEGIKNGDSEDDRQFFNLKELAERHGCAYTTIRDRSSRERWAEKKQAYQIQVTQERQKERAKRLAKNATEFDEKSFKVGELGINLVTMRLVEIAQEAQAKKTIREDAIKSMQAGEVVDPKDLRSAVWSKELEGLANAAERFQSIGMKALGTDVQKHTLSGPNGGPIEMEGGPIINVSEEIMRDDSERVAGLIKAFGDAGLLGPDIMGALGELEELEKKDDDIVDAEIVED